MARFILTVAWLLAVAWTFSMKQSEGFTRLWASIITVTMMVMSLALLSWSMRTLPLGTAYTVWTGIGAVGACVVGIALLGEPTGPYRLLVAF